MVQKLVPQYPNTFSSVAVLMLHDFVYLVVKSFPVYLILMHYLNPLLFIGEFPEYFSVDRWIPNTRTERQCIARLLTFKSVSSKILLKENFRFGVDLKMRFSCILISRFSLLRTWNCKMFISAKFFYDKVLTQLPHKVILRNLYIKKCNMQILLTQ